MKVPPLTLTLLYFSQVLRAALYKNLSSHFDLSISIRQNTTQHPNLDSTYMRIAVLEKSTATEKQVFRKGHYYLREDAFKYGSNSRSYSTNYNTPKLALNSDFGEVIVADLNFDGLDDFAVIYDGGINTGPFYYFYFQGENGRFYRNAFLTNEMGHFPGRIDNEKQRLTTLVLKVFVKLLSSIILHKKVGICIHPVELNDEIAN